MTKVLIMSDSHGLRDELTIIRQRHEHEVDAIIHCGDSELQSDAAELSSFIKVTGNCDMDPRYSNEEVVDIGGFTFLVVHGHLHQVKASLMPLSYRAQEYHAHIACFGHTHIAGAEKVDDILFINPGSILMPRGRMEKTYALLSWENPDSLLVDFYTVDGEVLEDMHYETKLHIKKEN
ncbi:metallophosphoesterase [Radiobacillus kanasensis]|uniref:metallophosphoesterase family protein n=1 Tax=Radiobacillus kanasensis TaxID=2844358 RepID=UPI001E48DBD4|nr:metallophosphoesterase [Radiobacillus kanasensis]UFT97962.1 metallophosphoesterase [Radiobacillus kanasensis]